MIRPRGCGTRPRAGARHPGRPHGRGQVGGVQPGRHAGGHGIGDHTARLWDAASGKALGMLAGHTDQVWSAAFSPDGTRVVTASDDNTARLWDAATGKRSRTAGHRSADSGVQPGRHARGHASDDNTARLWARHRQALAALQPTRPGLSRVQPGRHARGDRPSDKTARCGTLGPQPWQATRPRSSRRRSARTARAWSPRRTTRPRGCGTRRRASARHPGRPHGPGQIGGVQPGRHAGGHRVGRSAPRGCGTRPPARRSRAAGRPHRSRSGRRRSARTARGW